MIYDDPSFIFSLANPDETLNSNLSDLVRKGISDVTSGLVYINKPSQPHDQFIIKFLINKTMKGAVCSLYKYLVNYKFRTNKYPNLVRHWH